MTMKAYRLAGLGAATTVVALLFAGIGATAQDAGKALAIGKTQRTQEAKGKASGKPSARSPSPCQGLDAKTCKSKASECLWIVPRKGRQSPYCRLKTARRR